VKNLKRDNMGMTTNIERIGNATSSQIYRLMGTKQVFDSYVEECNMERELMRSVDKEENARQLTWGKLCETYLFGSVNLLGLQYRASGDKTRVHKYYPWWSGSEDGEFDDDVKGVLELKCPYTIKSFYRFSKAIQEGYISSVRDVKIGNSKDGEKYYWQMVSNACLLGVDYAEFCVYMPFEIELDAIRETAGEMENLNDYAWVNWAGNDQLPHLKVNGNLPNLSKLRFEIPKKDKELLEQKVIEFGSKLIPYNSEF
jgi:hypothetical protein